MRFSVKSSWSHLVCIQQRHESVNKILVLCVSCSQWRSSDEAKDSLLLVMSHGYVTLTSFSTCFSVLAHHSINELYGLYSESLQSKGSTHRYLAWPAQALQGAGILSVFHALCKKSTKCIGMSLPEEEGQYQRGSSGFQAFAVKQQNHKFCGI